MQKRQKQKIVWGVCGIGHGHTFRQMPLIDHFSGNAEIVILCYGESLNLYRERYKNHKNIHMVEVAVPFYVGRDNGLDFDATAIHPANQNIDFHKINVNALRQTRAILGQADLVISDYEPISAQYAYSQNVPLVTLDQQSKYLMGDFEQPLNEHYYQDEIERLRLFFPKAKQRLACSFFNVSPKQTLEEEVTICSPIFNDSVLQAAHIRKNHDFKDAQKSLIFYISAQQPFGQSLSSITDICRQFPNIYFHFFGKGYSQATDDDQHIKFYQHGDSRFHDILARCDGVISTAGHTLLSEAMYLGIPVLALPLPLYEQQMNAHIINHNKFGLLAHDFNAKILKEFIENLPDYAERIDQDKTVLNRTDGKKDIIAALNKTCMTPKV